ncbi:MAG: ClbS/DfsB family four-helix bundle protein [Chloroflexi bacterium]|nr:ClbS/DfsB family four-helix bundle protein [Chloroflexota bacterium]
MTAKLTPADKHELLTRIRAAWSEMDATIRNVDPDRLRDTPAAGGWSAKDHLAHIMVWLKVIAARIDRAPEHPIFGLDPGTFRTANVDGLNAAAHRLYREMPTAEVIAELASTHRKVVAMVESLQETDLARPIWSDRPGRGPLIDNIIGDTYEHYREHLADIRTLVRGSHG